MPNPGLTTPVVRSLAVLLILGHGCAVTIYQAVSIQMLMPLVGASIPTASLLWLTSVVGLCLGALTLPRRVSLQRGPFQTFAALQVAIVGTSLGIFFGIPWTTTMYSTLASSGPAGSLATGVLAGSCLLPPAVFMGAALPALSRLMDNVATRVFWSGMLYGGMSAGAGLGVLWTWFYLLRNHDALFVIAVAAALSLAVALAGLALNGSAAGLPVDVAPISSETPSGAAWPVYATLGMSGMVFGGAVYLWTRSLALLFGPTVYAFATVAGACVLCFGVACAGGSLLLAKIERPRVSLGACQLLLCGAIGWSGYAVAESLPYWPVNATLPQSGWTRFELDLLRALWAVFPAASLAGVSLPLGLAAAASPGMDAGRLAGRTAAAHAIGMATGFALAGVILIARLGTSQTEQLLIAGAAVACVLACLPIGTDAGQRLKVNVRTAVLLSLAPIVALSSSSIVGELPAGLAANGRFANIRPVPDVVYLREGVAAALAVSIEGDVLNFHSGGRVETSSYFEDVRINRMLGHLTSLIPDNPRSVLVMGMRAGVTAGAVGLDPEVERITVTEIEPLVSAEIAGHFSRQNSDVVNNPKVDVRIDDGRHFLLTTHEMFDGVVSAPPAPWIPGAAMMYTTEFWRLVRSHLNPGGIAATSVRLYETSDDAVRSQLATFSSVFPNNAFFANIVPGDAYDVVLVGFRDDDGTIDVGRITERLQDSRYSQLARSLRVVEFESGIELLGTFAGTGRTMEDWLEGASINSDRNLRLQYLAGDAINRYSADAIVDRMLTTDETLPDGLFIGPLDLMNRLHQLIGQQQGRN